jgi:hypothetical protein
MTTIAPRYLRPLLAGALLLAACNSKNDGTATGTGGAGGNAGGSAGNTAGAGGNAGSAGSAGGAGGTAGVGGSAASGCPVNPSACTDGMDNDGDGKIDGADPECVGACDNDEGTFATGISGDNIDACKQDCFFDGNSGMGDDGCEWNLKCDPASPGANATKACPYDANVKNCPAKQSDTCIKSCQRVTPNGCDCFGCCAVAANGKNYTVMLLSSCKTGLLDDPKACPPCTQQTSCVNTCGKCEVCVGKPAPDPSCVITPPAGDAGVPDGGTPPPPPSDASPEEGPCPAGVTYCGPGGSTCSGGAVCLTGCCLIP